MKNTTLNENFFNRYPSVRYPFFRALDLLLLVAFCSFLIYCVTVGGNPSVKSNAIGKPVAVKAIKS